MINYTEHLLLSGNSINEALRLLNKLSQDPIIFVVDNKNRLLGSVTDGDIRRGLIKGFNLESKIDEIIEKNTKYIIKQNNNLEKIICYRKKKLNVIPVVDENKRIVNIINFKKTRSYLPLDAVIIAGGRGNRLKPLTDNTPKPLLKVGDKPIIEYNLNRLIKYGLDDFWISLGYLGEQIENYFGRGENRNIKIQYVKEKKPLGTIGALSKITDFKHEYILITNSDLLTNLDYEEFFLEFLKKGADLAVLGIPYQVNIPYAVLETKKGNILSLKEKPTYTFYSNGGVYLIKKQMLKYIPDDMFFNATDLIDKLIKLKHKVISLPFSGYWLDIGKKEDFKKAQYDVKKIRF